MIHIRRNETISISAVVLVLIIIGWSILVQYITPAEILDTVGVSNGYIIVLIGGFFGGVSLFFPFPNYLLVLTFGAAGLNPILLGVTAALGIIAGECTSYFVGRASHPLVPKPWHQYLHKFNEKLIHKPYWVVFLVLLGIGIVPFPNDLALVPLGLLRYPFRKTIVPLAIGNIIYNILLAFAGHYGLILWTGI